MGGGPTFPAIAAIQRPMHQFAMDDVDKILAGKYPAKAHAKNVVEYIKKKGALTGSGGVLYLEGQKTRMNEDSDEAVPFRQVSPL